MERREFLKTSCLVCLGVQATLATSLFTGCSSLPVYRTSVADHEITVPKSVVAEGDFHLIHADNVEYQIALQRRDGRFSAILLRCTHAENPVTYTGHGFSCSLHGSMFDSNGAVTRGPASLPLENLLVQEYPDRIVIRLS